MSLTLYPVAADGTQEVGIQTVRLLDFVQQLSDVHHLKKDTNHTVHSRPVSRPLSVNHQDVKDSHLLSVQGVSGQFGQVKELQVQRAKLGQDAASGRCPAPTPAGATATESRAAA